MKIFHQMHSRGPRNKAWETAEPGQSISRNSGLSRTLQGGPRTFIKAIASISQQMSSCSSSQQQQSRKKRTTSSSMRSEHERPWGGLGTDAQSPGLQTVADWCWSPLPLQYSHWSSLWADCAAPASRSACRWRGSALEAEAAEEKGAGKAAAAAAAATAARQGLGHKPALALPPKKGRRRARHETLLWNRHTDVTNGYIHTCAPPGTHLTLLHPSHAWIFLERRGHGGRLRFLYRNFNTSSVLYNGAYQYLQ